MKNIMIFLGISCLTGVTVAACSGDNSTTPATDGGGEASSGASTGASSGSGTSSGTSTGASTGAADAGPMVMCQNKSVCTGSQICCVAYNGGISVACQAPPCMNIPTVGMLQLCATDAECYNAGDKCGMVMTPVMTVMACAPGDGGAGDGGHSDAPASDAPASDAPASDAPANDAPASDAPTG